MAHTNLTIQTPHNNFFIQVFSRKEKDKAFFEKYLPPSILAVADLNQLAVVESKHMSEAGLSLYNDVFYSCPLGKDQLGYLYTVAEHVRHEVARNKSAA